MGLGLVTETLSPASYTTPILTPSHPHTLTDTTDLQQLVVFSTSSRLVITCTLATGSDALGCNVMARPEGDPTPFWSVNLMRSDSDLELMMTFLLSEVDPPPGSFLIFASDLEADGSIGELQLSAEIQPTPSESYIVYTIHSQVYMLNYTNLLTSVKHIPMLVEYIPAFRTLSVLEKLLTTS